MKKKKRNEAPRCPYCGSTTILRSADGIYLNNSKNTMLYVCKRYPACDAYVRVYPGTSIPLGTLADGRLRRLRTEAHWSFNQLYRKGLMSKADAYRWLASISSTPLEKAHIGQFGEYNCRKVIAESNKLLSAQTQRRQPKF